MSNQDGGTTSVDPSFGMKLTLAGIRKKFSEVHQISTEIFYNMWLSQSSVKNFDLDTAAAHTVDDYVLFDVREKNERLVSFIKGSVWIDSSQESAVQVEQAQKAINEKITKLTTNEKKEVENLNVIAYCSIGYRSSDLIRKLLKTDMSFKPLETTIKFYNLDGSLFKWANEGKPIVDSSDSPTHFVHPYNALWGKLLNERLRKYSN